METFGNRLKEIREKKGYSLEQAEDETKIRRFYLQLLEEERFDGLPAQVYAVGFVRRYARFLDLNEEDYVEEFKALAYQDRPREEKYFSQSYEQTEEPLGGKLFSLKNILSAVVFLVLAVWMGNMVVDYVMSRVDLEPPAPHSREQAAEEIDLPVGPPLEEEEPQEAEGVNLVISATQDCWLEVVVDQEVRYSGILQKGEERIFAGEEAIYLIAGNAGGLQIIYNGEEIPPIGNYGQVVEKEFARQGPHSDTGA